MHEVVAVDEVLNCRDTISLKGIFYRDSEHKSCFSNLGNCLLLRDGRLDQLRCVRYLGA